MRKVWERWWEFIIDVRLDTYRIHFIGNIMQKFPLPINSVFLLNNLNSEYENCIWRKPPTCRKSLKTLSHNVVLSTPRMSAFIVFNTTFNNISVISWWSVLLVEETKVLGENHWPVASHWQTLSHNVVYSTCRHEQGSDSQL